MVCTIHQFSQGIKLLSTDDGKWSSDGFSGKWDQITSPFPRYIEDAIKGDKFKGKSISSANPAITARVVPGDENKFWSVVAIIARATDLSRPFSTYRYFWCEGKDNLCLIVAWLLEQKNIPIFDPFETNIMPIYLKEEEINKYRQQVYLIENEINKPEFLNWLNQHKDSQNIILSPDLYKENELLVVDRLANKIAINKNRLTSWAFNVENLNKPEGFLIIQPVSEAYERLKSSPSASLVIVESPFEAELKSVIQDIKDSQLTRQIFFNLEFVLSKLKNTQNSKELLDQIFDDLGATDALEHQMYQSGRMELVTVRAILLPETLLEYLQYAHIEEKTSTYKFQKILSGDNQIKQQSLDFQSRLRQEIKHLFDSNSLPNLKLKLRDGLISIIEKLYDEQISTENAFWIINHEESFWSLSCDSVIETVKSDLSTIQKKIDQIRKYHYNNDVQMIAKEINDLNLKIWSNLIKSYWIPTSNKQYVPAYESFSKVFYKSYMLTFYFNRISGNDVPKEIIKYLRDHNHLYVYGVPVTYVIHSQQQGDKSSNKWVEYFNIIVCIIAIFVGLVVIVNVWWVKLIFGVVALFWTLLFYEVATIRNFIKTFSLSLIIIAFICGNSSSQYLSIIPQPKTTPSPTPTSSSSSEGKADLTLEQQRQKILDNAVDLFMKKDKTYDAIEKIKKNLSSDPELISIHYLRFTSQRDKDTIIRSALNEVLFQSNNDYQDIDDVKNNPSDSKGIKQKLNPLVEAIYQYQEKNRNNIYYFKGRQKINVTPDGIINLTDITTIPNSTMAVLQKEIKQKIIDNQ
jgi:hypothetical protein